MKYRLSVLLVLAFGAFSFAQEGIKIGIQGSFPFNDFKEAVVLSAAVDVGYMHALGEVVDAGVMTGFINGFPDNFDGGPDLPSIQFLPLAGSFRIWPSNSFSFGGDAGYAVGINDGNEGGLYYRPVIGYLFGTNTEVNLSYTGIQLDGATWSTVNVGIMHTIQVRPRRL
ncbi:hypothetical protein [Muriicola marianensis]|uniref:Outer membrane beta-barrel protein n=1 Tax=Muriicola marianensis TaxID=1324801 RepID=A0ABQ1QUK1_9FLAO|nr:hypothetical protein [Muriicola marianensis]GGD42312.1 hypothetical protein GCM10011361_06610 [Muriicola marianensis]